MTTQILMNERRAKDVLILGDQHASDMDEALSRPDYKFVGQSTVSRVVVLLVILQNRDIQTRRKQISVWVNFKFQVYMWRCV